MEWKFWRSYLNRRGGIDINAVFAYSCRSRRLVWIWCRRILGRLWYPWRRVCRLGRRILWLKLRRQRKCKLQRGRFWGKNCTIAVETFRKFSEVSLTTLLVSVLPIRSDLYKLRKKVNFQKVSKSFGYCRIFTLRQIMMKNGITSILILPTQSNDQSKILTLAWVCLPVMQWLVRTTPVVWIPPSVTCSRDKRQIKVRRCPKVVQRRVVEVVVVEKKRVIQKKEITKVTKARS